jgi:hypothetical protein
MAVVLLVGALLWFRIDAAAAFDTEAAHVPAPAAAPEWR